MTDTEQVDFGQFTPTPETGDLKTLNELVVRAGEIQAGLKKLADRSKTGEKQLKELLETQIPGLMKRSGMAVGDSIKVSGFTVELRENEFAGIPALSTVEKERDSDKREELIARRNKAFELLEILAPSLIKRTFEVSFDKDSDEEAKYFENFINEYDGNEPLEITKGKTVHPKTLAKWIKEKRADGTDFTVEVLDTLGSYTREVAKITV